MVKMPTKQQKESSVNILDREETGGKLVRDGNGRFVNGHEGMGGRPQGSLSPSVQRIANWGLTPELITTSLVEDIKAKPQKRVEELKLGAKVLKMTDEEHKPPVQEVTVIKEQKNIYLVVEEAERKLREELEK